MQGILVLAHGSRVKTTQDTINAVVDMMRDQFEGTPLEIAYMEFCEVNIEKGIANLVEQGVTEIKAVPYFLFEGIHIREDIPNEVEEALKKHPNVTLRIGNTLGVDRRLADILADRIREL